MLYKYWIGDYEVMLGITPQTIEGEIPGKGKGAREGALEAFRAARHITRQPGGCAVRFRKRLSSPGEWRSRRWNKSG